MSAEIIHLEPGAGQAVSAVGDVYRFLATGRQTNGQYALVEARVLPGGGPPPHLHRREEEAFFVLEGEIAFYLGEKRIVGKPGTFLQIPRGQPHRFKNEGQTPGRMLVLTTPAGFDTFLQEFAHPLPSFEAPPTPVTPDDIAKLLAVAPKYGIEVLPPG